ncbi:hypothetical protein GALL_433180 [mine drainage metagenome]|uniref:Uncharacterized protein n=1 Tax=mine drainage metagenome TaxID=410659 RepID=A0A1J5Q556_9ZZZZ
MLDQCGVVAYQHAAPRGGDDLVAVEGKHRKPAKASAGASAVARSQRFGGVFQHRHAGSVEQRHDRVHLGALTVEVDDHGGLRCDVFSAQRIERCGQSLRRHVPTLRLGVDEYRRGAELPDRVGAGDEGEAGTQHHVARPHAQQSQAEMQRGGARIRGRGMLHADLRGQLAFEGVDMGAERCDPVAAERLLHQRHLIVTQMRRREIDALRQFAPGDEIDRAPGGIDHRHMVDAPRVHQRQHVALAGLEVDRERRVRGQGGERGIVAHPGQRSAAQVAIGHGAQQAAVGVRYQQDALRRGVQPGEGVVQGGVGGDAERLKRRG